MQVTDQLSAENERRQLQDSERAKALAKPSVSAWTVNQVSPRRIKPSDCYGSALSQGLDFSRWPEDRGDVPRA